MRACTKERGWGGAPGGRRIEGETAARVCSFAGDHQVHARTHTHTQTDTLTDKDKDKDKHTGQTQTQATI